MFIASLLSESIHRPSQAHYYAPKRVLRYITDKIDYGSCFLKDESEHLQGYADSDWLGRGSFGNLKTYGGERRRYGGAGRNSLTIEAKYISVITGKNLA